MKIKILLIIALSYAGLVTGQEVQLLQDSPRGVIKPSDTSKIDLRKRSRCMQIVAEVEAMTAECDVFRIKNGRDLFEVVYDKSGRLRKYLWNNAYYDGAAEHETVIAYYDAVGQLVRIFYNSGSHCDDNIGLFYVDNGHIVDFKMEFYDYCSEGESYYVPVSDEPKIGDSFGQAEYFGRDLADFICADSVSARLNPEERKTKPIFVDWGVVTDAEGSVNLRDQTDASKIIGKVESGEWVKVVEDAGSYYVVKTWAGVRGRIHKSRISW